MREILEERLKIAAELVSDTGLLELVNLIWSTDKHYTFSGFHATSRHLAAKLREWDVRARTFEIPADGKTVYGEMKMPLGWECTEAKLEIYDPYEERGRVLADRKKTNTAVVMWSGPTPPTGLIAEVVRVETPKDIEEKKAKIKGRIVYTPMHPQRIKQKLVEAGAAAVVSSFSPVASHFPRATFWVNAWADDPNGWAFHEGDTPLPGMMISPETGVELDVLLDRGSVKLKMRVDSKYEATTMPVLCGYLDGPLQEEILAIGHTMEQGANDNATGAAVIAEMLRALQDGTKSGKLPAMRRAVRGIFTNECYGTIGFAGQNPGIIRRMLAGVNWDSMGRHQESVNAWFRHCRCPDASASVADTLMAILLANWLPANAPHLIMKPNRNFALTDNAYCDPSLGVHCTYIDSHDDWWHTSNDTMELVSGKTLHAFATISTVYVHFLASATAKEAIWLAHETIRRYGERIEATSAEYAAKLEVPGADKALIQAQAADHLEYVRQICELAVMSAKRFMLREERAQGHLTLLKLMCHPRRLVELEKRRLKELAGCEPGVLPPNTSYGELGELRPYKKFIGTPTYETVPAEKRDPELNAFWDSTLHCACFWSEGKLTFAEIMRRIGYEYGVKSTLKLPAHFKFMGENGLIKWLKPGEAIPKPAKPAKSEEHPDEHAPEAEHAEAEHTEAAATEAEAAAAESESGDAEESSAS